MSVTRTFAIHYRPSSASATEPRFWGNDGEYHNGLDQTITFPMNRKLGNDVVWTVSYNTAHHGPSPLEVASPTDSLNVGLAPNVRVGHDRFHDSIFWDTTYQGFTCADPTDGNGGPFVTGELNRDGSCNGTRTRGRDTCPRRGSPLADETAGALRPPYAGNGRPPLTSQADDSQKHKAMRSRFGRSTPARAPDGARRS